jgi:hypothetical protein
MPGAPAEAFAQADAVLMGEVTAIADRNPLPFSSWLQRWFNVPVAYGREVNVAVANAWKGLSTTTATLFTGYGDADCGYTFVVGTTYVIYAHETADGLETNICTRTAEVSGAADDLLYLGTQSALTLTPAPARVAWLVGGIAVLCASLVAVVVGTLTLWWRRRRTPSPL